MKEETSKRSVVFILGTISALIGSVAIFEFMKAEPWGLPDISPGGNSKFDFTKVFPLENFSRPLQETAATISTVSWHLLKESRTEN